MSTVFRLEEATVTDINRAFDQGILTAERLVQLYLNRIEAYDQTGPLPLNAIIAVNPAALETARKLDAERKANGPRSPLHGIPMIVKDNFDTGDLPTTAGSVALKQSQPPDDAFQVRRLREAGAILLAKANLAEFAWSPMDTISSISGLTRNPYDLNRVPAGSSGGTAAAIAANFATLGLGTDTGNSIRGPSAHQALVGLRSTMGLTSRDGIVPLYSSRDMGGPMVRTVTDAALMLNAIAGFDPADPATEAVKNQVLPDYTTALTADGLQGTRLGVVEEFFLPMEGNDFRSPAHPDVVALMKGAIATLTAQGATVIPITVPRLALYRKILWGTAENTFAYDLERYLRSLGPKVEVRSLADIAERGLYGDEIKPFLLESVELGRVPLSQRRDIQEADTFREELRQVLHGLLDDNRLDALIFPTWSYPPRLVGDVNSPAGNNSSHLAPPTGFPAITVPMGYSLDQTLPAGLQFLARPFDELILLRLVYTYEQATHHRRSPAAFPPLPGEIVEGP